MQVRQFIVIAALGMTLAALGGCRDSKTPTKAPADALRGAAAGYNVLILTLDTTRADRLGCYGWKRAVTPVLDGLAQHGVRFDQAFSAAPTTLPAHVALFTGTYPPENGVRNNTRYALRPDLPTLAEVFRGQGYQTGAFIASRILAARYGLARGFDVYKDEMPQFERPANEVCNDTLAWLEQVRDKPFFGWVHFYDPHTPYAPPGEYLGKTGDAYDGEIAFMDANIGRLVAWLESNQLRSKTLIVAVADHGESLGEHGFLWHSLLVYDSIMRVPLIFSLPGRVPENATRTGVVSLADIMPTIIDLMGWRTPAEVSGESLLAMLTGSEAPARQAYGETDYGYEDFGWAKLRCLIEQKWKYIRAPEVELYDRLADPGELHNLAPEHADLVTRLEDDLTALEAGMTLRESVAVAPDAESMAVLRSLGYVAGPPTTGGQEGVLKNPKDMVEVCHNFRKAEALLGSGQTAEALSLLEPDAARSPESFVIVELLGKAYASAELYEFAELTLGQALAMQPTAADTWAILARVLEMRQAYTRAIKACEEALQLDPEQPLAERMLPQLRQSLERQTAKIAALRDKLNAEPESAELALGLAQELATSGVVGEAVRVLRGALDRHADNGDLANGLAWILATSPDDKLRNGAEALRWAHVACSGDRASNPVLLDTLAAAQAETGDFASAVATVQRAIDLATESGNKRRGAILARRLKFYEEKHPFRVPE